MRRLVDAPGASHVIDRSAAAWLCCFIDDWIEIGIDSTAAAALRSKMAFENEKLLGTSLLDVRAGFASCGSGSIVALEKACADLVLPLFVG